MRFLPTFVSGEDAGFAMAKRVACSRIYARIRVFWRELVATFAVSLIASMTAFADPKHAALESFLRVFGVAAHTDALSALTLTIGVDNEIFPAQWMAALAVGFRSVQRRSGDTVLDGVSTSCYRAQMLRVDAGTVATDVIDRKIVWNWTLKSFVGNAMRS